MNNRRRNWFRVRKEEPVGNAFISTWDTSKTSAGSSASNQISLPLVNAGNYNFVVDWGDGNTDTIQYFDQAERTHTYASSGIYTITITGQFQGIRFGNTGDRLKISNIAQWGDYQNSISDVFQGCANLDITATDILDLGSTTSMQNFFRNCTNLVFNDSINNWDVSNITSLVFAFSGTKFNSPLNNWNVGNVTNMQSAFQNASLFNQPLNNWDVSKVTTFLNTFNGTAFNQNINNWNVTGASTFQSMFQNTPFNQPLNNWNMAGATNLTSMFQSSSFNQNISGWNVGNVTSFSNTFNGSAFNQNIGGWNVSKGTNFTGTFRNNQAFSFDVSDWNISKATSMGLFMSGKSDANYSAQNLDNIYNKWSLLPVVSGILISFGTIKYTSAGQAGKNVLTGSPNNWVIDDGGI